MRGRRGFGGVAQCRGIGDDTRRQRLDHLADDGFDELLLRGEMGVERAEPDVREITDRADIGFGSFYSHFASKEELIEAVVSEMIQSLSASVIADSAALGDSAEAAATAHRWFIGLATTHPEVARLIVNLDRADVLLETSVLADATAAIERGV